jgi:hypothetical protein
MEEGNIVGLIFSFVLFCIFLIIGFAIYGSHIGYMTCLDTFRSVC